MNEMEHIYVVVIRLVFLGGLFFWLLIALLHKYMDGE